MKRSSSNRFDSTAFSQSSPMITRFSLIIFAAMVLSSASLRITIAAEPTKLAFLVGVSSYDKAGLRNLKYAENDASDLAIELKKAGFTVKLMLGSAKDKDRATAENLREHLSKEFVESLKKLNRRDLVLIAFAGHGVQRVVKKGETQTEDVFYCPVDCFVNDKSTDSFLSISDLMDAVASQSGSENNIFVIDACRDNPARGRGIDGSKVTQLPGNMAVLFGASSGTQSYESDTLKHGLLTHYMLEALSGKAKDEDGEVSLQSMVNYTMKQVVKNSQALIQEDQTPNFISNIRGAPPVLARFKVSSLESSSNRVLDSINKDTTKNEKPANPFPDYLPSDVGNQWVYKVKATQNGEVKTGEMINTVRKPVKIDGYECTVIEATLKGKVLEVEYSANTAKGLFRFKLTNSKYSPPLCIIKYPFKAGESWQDQIIADGVQHTFRVKIIGKEDITVPNGTYKDCVVSEVTAPSDPSAPISTYWFAEKVGMVKQVFVQGSNRTEAELASFKPAKLETSTVGGSKQQLTRPAMLHASFDEKTARTTQAKWAAYLNRSGTLMKNGIGMEMQLIPSGEFVMGGETIEKLVADFPRLKGDLTPEVDKDGSNMEEIKSELPLHKVQISEPFYMGKFHVTKKQFREFIEATGYKTEPETNGEGGRGYDPAGKVRLPYNPRFSWTETGFKYDDDHPVVNVTWNDADKFCKWLSKKEGRTYRLPTEAEWEYSCRAGTTTRYHNGNDPEKLIEIGNVTDASIKTVLPNLDTIKGNDGYKFTSPVGLFKPNGFGLHEMQGNVPVFCADWYAKNYYDNSQLRDPQGPNGGEYRIFRGGGWLCVPYQCRTGYRHTIKPTKCCCCIGFRVACEVQSNGE